MQTTFFLLDMTTILQNIRVTALHKDVLSWETKLRIFGVPQKTASEKRQVVSIASPPRTAISC
jgi:hypothetical protein